MDYDFQQPTVQHTERDEYRNRFKFADDDKPKKKKVVFPKTKTDYLVRLMLLQIAVCLLFAGGVFIASKVSPAYFEKMKNDYTVIMEKDMSSDELAQSLKELAQEVFVTVKIHEDNEKKFETYEVVSDETGEKVAVGEISDGSGGGDMAADGTSFAPYFVTVNPVLPVKNARITSRFGYRTNPISGNYGFHTGLDLAAESGTPVSASFYGRIIETGESDVWGKYVLMEHSEGFETYYCHLSAIYVEEGAVIRQGETVGLVGSTGWSTGPHLHFEVRINDVRVNPELLLYPENCDEN